ncbi:4-alpha-glucanotransferase [Rhodobacteraceae bacterium 2376]|uniref:4-alpha-glucanotransferase n=1 Tax=Rhabdonatronobacter sediminivivens TaxID=2743469 RepID=A0A7Z0KWD9_9RHOB|nr:4-alpha-glucanotransferase [Rhabdonatronobacter sediminivivens]NYS23689.1 4-alpha-glucanotransferase [Rhabdonatronobacter sediminivivens]
MSAFDDLCRAMGLVWAYRDGAGQDQCAPVESRRAVLAAMGLQVDTDADARDALQNLPPAPDWHIVRPDTPAPLTLAEDWHLTLEDGTTGSGPGGTALPPLPLGLHRLDTARGSATLLAAPPRLPPPAPAWGLTVPLYGLWEGAQSGAGTYTLLRDLTAALAPLGAGFLGLNPIHAGFADPCNYSPYAPSHRRRWNTLHIDLGTPHQSSGDLVNYAPVQAAQQAALRQRFDAFAGDPAFDRWRSIEGQALEDFATHQALAETHGPYWPDWPAELHSPCSPLVRQFAARHPKRVTFHAWCQWLAEMQLAHAARAARPMAHGLYLDLAVGTHPAGAETWAERELFARGVSLGAPPDLLGPQGQRWNLAPMDPRALAASGFAALAQTLRQQLRFAGLLRIDHILGFERAFWMPDDLPGLYVTMPRDAMLAVVRIEATRASASIIGEDLGTIPDGLRDALAASGILGCRVAMFERDWQGDGRFLPAARYDPHTMVSFGTHDLPPWAGWRQGRDLDWRATLDETPAPAAQSTRRAEVAAFDQTAGTSGNNPLTLHAFLARTPAPLVAFQAEDICGVIEQPNLPGTVFEHPNWRRRLPLPCSDLAKATTLRDSAASYARIRNAGKPDP